MMSILILFLEKLKNVDNLINKNNTEKTIDTRL